MTDPAKPRLSGWCSPYCTPRSHKTCQERMDKGQFPPGFICECPDHTRKEDTE